MRITIDGSPEEIAALMLGKQDRQIDGIPIPRRPPFYSGLIDVNGVKIYVGDRVCANNIYGTVEWHRAAFSVLWDDVSRDRSFLGYLDGVMVVSGKNDDEWHEREEGIL